MQDERARPRFADSGEPDIDLATTPIYLPSGRRPTDAVVEEIVEEARRGAGRPSLDGTAENSPRIAFRVPESVRSELGAIATREGKTFSQVCREALEGFLRNRAV